jgi:hypothetical protein
VEVSSEITSAPVTITGLDGPAAIEVSVGGYYSVGCTGTFVSTPGTIDPGETVCVRHRSAATNSTSTDTTLTIGGASDTFTSTTVAAPGGGGGGGSLAGLDLLALGLIAWMRRPRKATPPGGIRQRP